MSLRKPVVLPGASSRVDAQPRVHARGAGNALVVMLGCIGAPCVAAQDAVAVQQPAAAALAVAAAPNPRTLDSIDVIGRRRALSDFPGSVSVIDAGVLHDGQREVSLAESLSRVPGISVLDRQNYAQDLQVQSRGFGARSTFGIRGIRLVVDGIPASAPDGQGQAANFPIGALDRIEVLRGPLALQYGNAAGGAIVGYTDLDDATPGVSLDGWAGSDDTYRASARWDGEAGDGDWRWRVLGTALTTDGARPHSAARRNQFNAVARFSPRPGQRLRLVVNLLDQPESQDPLGLTRAGLRADPHGTDAVARQFDTRKTIANNQVGLRWSDDYAAGRSWWVGGYGIDRKVLQYLAIPIGAQLAPASAGGVIDLGRTTTGLDIGHRWEWARASLAVGAEASRLDEARRGYENFVGTELGVRGRLRRDERNQVDDDELYAIGDVRLGDRWSALGAVRHSAIDIDSDDRFMAPGNGDDSGTLRYRRQSGALGLSRSVAHGEFFASLGRGFETPTVTELAYRPDGAAGLNTALQPSRLKSAELGARMRLSGVTGSVAVYRIQADGEIVPATSRGGRASFANAGRTQRDGVELGLAGGFAAQWSWVLTANAIRARFDDTFAYQVSGAGGTVTRVVQAGNRIPGIPRADGYAELAWHAPGEGIDAALEMRASSAIPVDDLNSDAAAGNARFALRMQWKARANAGWHGFARVDNLFDRDAVGSVIVNEGNSRFFEPAAGRTWTIGIGWNFASAG